MRQDKLLTESFTYTGKWFLPGCEDHVVNGTLTYSAGSIEIKISGALRDETKHPTTKVPFGMHEEDERLDTLLGITDDGVNITLEKCYMIHHTRTGIPLTGKSFENTTYNVASMYVGNHYNFPTDKKFNRVMVNYTNFKEWVNESGIKTDHDINTDKFTITAKRPPSHKGNLPDNFKYEIWHQIDNPGYSLDMFDATIKQDAVIIISSDQKRPYEEFYKTHYRLQHFVMMGIMYNIRPLLITTATNDSYKDVLVYNGYVDVSGGLTIIRNDQMFLNLASLPGKLEDIFQHWLTVYKELDDAFSLFFENMINSKLYPQDRFENVIQALEAYHRGRFDDNLIEKSEYENMIADILSKLNDKKQKDWVKKYKSRGNDLSLSQKLIQILEKFPYLLQDPKKKEEFVTKVQDTRNYFAHHSKKLREKAAENVELYYLEQRLNVLMVACMLSELGFDESTLEKLVIKYAKRRGQFKIVWSPDPYEWLV